MIDFLAEPSETDPPDFADPPFACPADEKPVKFSWPDDHSKELETLHATGLSFSEIARAINEKFGTTYSRNATIGRAGRMGLVRQDRRQPIVCKQLSKRIRYQPYKPRPKKEKPALFSAATIQLRCEEIVPRMIPLIELERGDCRFPYGDGPFLFCANPAFEDRSYCETHYHLCRDTFSPAIRGSRATDPANQADMTNRRAPVMATKVKVGEWPTNSESDAA